MVCPCRNGNGNGNQIAVNPNTPQPPECEGRLSVISRRIQTVPRNVNCRPRSVRMNRIRTGRSLGLKGGTAMNPNIDRKTKEEIRQIFRNRGCNCGTRRPNAFFG